MHMALRYHDISCGHRVVGHENKCRHLHGHNYRVHFHCVAELDTVGRVIDFGVIKSHLCMWIEDHWDHHLLIWEEDPMLPALKEIDPSVVAVPFNPTAENMAQYLVQVIGPAQLEGLGVKLQKVTIEETAKCSASYEVD
jgi:6-pyruvoyltetrahydropterin/6-carboxytetrahydropterin synthase